MIANLTLVKSHICSLCIHKKKKTKAAVKTTAYGYYERE